MVRENSERQEEANSEEPVDYRRFVYIVLLIHGIGTLLPWNMFITAHDYFEYKLTGPDGAGLAYNKNFLSYVGIASKLPNVIVQLLNFLIGGKSRTLSNRIIWSIILEFLIFGFTAGLAVVDSSQWIPSFFWITMISVIAINIWNGIYQNCIYGVVAALPPKYLNVVVTGMNLSGVVSAICAIISMAAAPSKSTSATAYFTLAVVFLIVCLVTYLMLLKNAFFVHYMKSAETNDQEERGVSRRESTASANPLSDNHINGPKQTRASSTIFREKVKLYMHILKQIWHQLLNIFFVYYVSLLLFPAVLGKVTSVNKFAGDYFGSVFCFLSFNLFSALGNLMLNYVPKIPAKYLWIPILARLAFIPFFLYCNFDAENRISVVLFGDWVYSIGVVIFALNTGYLSSLAIYYAPKLVEPEHASLAGMMSSFSIMVGIMAGIFSSLGIIQFH